MWVEQPVLRTANMQAWMARFQTLEHGIQDRPSNDCGLRKHSGGILSGIIEERFRRVLRRILEFPLDCAMNCFSSGKALAVSKFLTNTP